MTFDKQQFLKEWTKEEWKEKFLQEWIEAEEEEKKLEVVPAVPKKERKRISVTSFLKQYLQIREEFHQGKYSHEKCLTLVKELFEKVFTDTNHPYAKKVCETFLHYTTNRTTTTKCRLIYHLRENGEKIILYDNIRVVRFSKNTSDNEWISIKEEFNLPYGSTKTFLFTI